MAYVFDLLLTWENGTLKMDKNIVPDFESGIQYEPQHFHSSHSTDFIGIGPEVDEKWHSITSKKPPKRNSNANSGRASDNFPLTGGALGTTRQQLEMLNPNHDTAVQLDGAGQEGLYMATFDILHQIHCVVRNHIQLEASSVRGNG